jgi:predicted transcriptional regulator
MANLTIEMPDDLVRSLEGLAAGLHKTVQELAVERLRSLVEVSLESGAGSPAAVLRAMREPPHPSALDVEELEMAIAAARVPVQTRDLFFGLTRS